MVVVEAAQKSGALITAHHAAVQGRSVLAVPGPVESAASEGTNALIREGAVLCRGVEDVLEELQGIPTLAETVSQPASRGTNCQPVPQPPPELDEVQRRVWEFLADQARHLDEMAQQLGLAVPQLAGVLLTLEMKKAVRRLPGNRYERC